MSFLDLLRRKPATPVERRNYTDLLTAGFAAAASGTAVSATEVGFLGALEVCAGTWARAFASARVEPQTPVTAALTPGVLSAIGRRLIRRGEAVHVIDVDPSGAVRLDEASWWDVQGGPRPPWTYQTTLTGPSTTETRWVQSDGVLHVRYAYSEAAPWRGIAPLGWAARTGALAAALERSLADEAGGPVGSLVPVPEGQREPTDGDQEGDDPLADLKADVAKLRGALAFVETMAGGYGDRGGRPDADWKPRRIGADPPETLAALRTGAALTVFGACGVPPSLVTLPADGTGQREAWRRFLHGSVGPVARIVEAELAAKLDTPDLRLVLDDLAAADMTGRARAWRSLVGPEATLDPATAARLVLGIPDAGDVRTG